MFLASDELNKLSKWKYNVQDNSITTKLFKNFWNKCESYISPQISPNIITFTGFIFLLSNYILSYLYYDKYSLFIELYVILSTQIYCHLDAIDGIHARNTNTSSPLGELLDHICDAIGLIFIILTFCNIFNIDDIKLQICITLCGMLIFQSYHIKAYLQNIVEFGKYSGPTEMLLGYCIIIFLKSLNIISGPVFNSYLNTGLYYIIPTLIVIINYMNIYIFYNKCNYVSLVNQIIFTILYFIVYISIFFNLYYQSNIYYIFNICLNICVLTCDLIISKMANKNINIFLIIIFICCRINNIFGIIISMYYIIICLYDIAKFLKINLIYHNLKNNK